jgi:V/A-type H+/Na+-transporting ATPase subunit K
MYWLITIIAVNVLGTLGLGAYFGLRPPADGRRARRWWKGTLATHLLVFVGLIAGLVVLGMHAALAQQAPAPAVPAPHGEISVGLGLALLGAGLPTALAAFGAGLAVGPVGAAALAIISEKPEMFGRTLIYLGLAEGIAIYGLVITILLLGKIA